MIYNVKIIIKYVFGFIPVLFATTVAAQDSEDNSAQTHDYKSVEIGGYVSDMPSFISIGSPEAFYWNNLVHNRLNFGWQFAENWRIDAGMRNRFIFGSEYLVQSDEMAKDNGWLNLTWNNYQDRTVVLNSTFDRLNITFERDEWKLQLGRQRINWGQTFVWNPNDIFNTYSFFDFDYTERPGCDAFRATFYHSETASSELASSINRYGKATAALMHHRNWQNIDFQGIVGYFEQTDIVVGGAVTGDYKGLNCRGEISVFKPVNISSDKTIVAASVGLDYIFANSLMLQTEFLYNNASQSGNLTDLLSAEGMSAKRLSVSDKNLFFQASYPLTPRLNSSLSGMYFVDINAFYTGFSIDYSLASNFDLSCIAQYFGTESQNMSVLLAFARIKWSF
ncbi:MAG: hypothetical protein LBD53_05200 [Tannerella sp.]|jgi:hypothetical protein|nr:hypothetical protein [Tannerella sp.]